jgi:hypothetical protein
MPVMKITGQGLCLIAVLTGILWGCIFAEKLTVLRAQENGRRAVDEIRALELKKRIVPATSPFARPRASRPIDG